MIIEVQSAVWDKWLFLFHSWNNCHSGIAVVKLQRHSDLACEQNCSCLGVKGCETQLTKAHHDSTAGIIWKFMRCTGVKKTNEKNDKKRKTRGWKWLSLEFSVLSSWVTQHSTPNKRIHNTLTLTLFVPNVFHHNSFFRFSRCVLQTGEEYHLLSQIIVFRRTEISNT